MTDKQSDYRIPSRPRLELKTGIKSSLPGTKQLVALAYLIYKVSDDVNDCKYSQEYQQGGKTLIQLSPHYQALIKAYLGRDIVSQANNNPLINAQVEHLQVGLELMLHLCKVRFVNRQNYAIERVGGSRYEKTLSFTTNMMVLDLIIAGFAEQIQKDALFAWLDKRRAPADFEERVSAYLTTLLKNTVFKIRTEDGEEKYFNTEFLYGAVVDGSFNFQDAHEFVGPTRVLRAYISEGVDPWLKLSGTSLSQRSEPTEVCSFDSFYKMLRNTLDLENTETINQQEPDTPADDIIEETKLDAQIAEDMKNYIEALKTKPFLLLAGISGTGKSQKVKELAYMTCPENELGSTATTPGNYCLIEVKPNWHDSAELLGYYSNLTGMYHVTDFLRFAYKAAMNPDYPFFVCLDEMNLAPVEQYFAEYLSVLETRTVVGGKIESAMLLTKESFESYDLDKEYAPEDRKVVEYIQQNGLSLPENLFVIGTVNMDDTTHQFSRKVIDRAFTIEMNGGDLDAMFSDENTMALSYRNEPVPLSVFKPKYVKAAEALEDSIVGNYSDKIKEQVPAILTKVNEILRDTPFRVSYRVQNELILYIANMILNSSATTIDIDAVIREASLIILLEKILPRVQGDDKLLSDADGSVFKKLVAELESSFSTLSETNVYGEVIAKLNEMDKRLKNTYFANFF